jgi:PAS domain S-box-containing protein
VKDDKKTKSQLINELTELRRQIAALVKKDTERKGTHPSVNEYEMRYKTLFDRSLFCVYLHDLQGNLFDANETALRLLGYTHEELSSLNILSLIPEEQRPIALQRVDEILKSGAQKISFEYRVKKKSGEYLWLEVEGALIMKHGKPYAIQGIARDITESKQREQALLESEALFRSQFEFGNIGIAITSVETGWVRVNLRLCDMLGYSEEELLQKTWVEMTYPDDLAPDLEKFNQMLAGKIEAYEMDKRFIRKDGSIIVTHLTVSCFRNQDRSVRFVIASLQDITERKEIEKALQDNEERLESIFRASPSGIGLVSSPDRIILKVNERLCTMLGYSQDELVGKSARILYRTDEDFELVGKRKYALIREHGVGTVETRWQCKDGRIIDVLLSSSPIDKNNFSLGITFTALDITEQKRAEKLLKTSEEELKKKVKALEDFYNIAVGRELRMKQLKAEIAEIKEELEKYKKLQ